MRVTTLSAHLTIWHAQWHARVSAQSDRGASLVEYALLVVLIAVVCLIAIQVLGDQASTSFSRTGSGLQVAG